MPYITRSHDEAGQQRPVGGAAGDTALPMREFRMNRRERVGNAIVSLLARAGIGPIWLLTTRGRMTGRPRTNPVVPVEQDGRRWWSPAVAVRARSMPGRRSSLRHPTRVR